MRAGRAVLSRFGNMEWAGNERIEPEFYNTAAVRPGSSVRWSGAGWVAQGVITPVSSFSRISCAARRVVRGFLRR